MLDPKTLSSLKVTELKAELKKRGLPVGGLKQILVERLAEDILQERQKAQEAEAVAPKEQVPVEDVEQDNEETIEETVHVAPGVDPGQPTQEEVRANTPEPEPAQVQEPEPERELVKEQVQQYELVQQLEQVQEGLQEPEPTPLPEQAQEELPVRSPPPQEHEASGTDTIEEKPQAASEQLASEQQQGLPDEKSEEKEELVNQAEEQGAPVEVDNMQVDTVPEKTPEDVPAFAPEQPAAREEDAPMAEAPVEVPTEASKEPPVTAMSEATTTPAPLPFPTSTEDETTPQSDLAALTAPSEPMDTREDTPLDPRKRKHRSASPPPVEEALPTSTEVPEPEEASVSKKPRASSPAAPKPRQRDARFKGLFNNGDAPIQEHDATDSTADPTATAAEDDDDLPVPPSIHPATRALYIRNLIRPINDLLLRSHLSTLAGTTTGEAVEFFFVDTIKSHALIIFTSVTAATRVRVGVHGKVWPNERTRKPLWVDFVPEEAVEGWVQREKKSRARWEVVYKEDEEDGSVRAELEEVGTGSTKMRGRGGVSSGRGVELLGAPTGPRSAKERVGERKNTVLAVQKQAPIQPPADVTPATTSAGPRPPRVMNLDDLFKSTLAKPKLYYMPVSEEVARERLGARGRNERGRNERGRNERGRNERGMNERGRNERGRH